MADAFLEQTNTSAVRGRDLGPGAGAVNLRSRVELPLPYRTPLHLVQPFGPAAAGSA